MEKLEIGNKVLLNGQRDEGVRDSMTVVGIDDEIIDCMWKTTDGYAIKKISRKCLKTPS